MSRCNGKIDIRALDAICGDLSVIQQVAQISSGIQSYDFRVVEQCLKICSLIISISVASQQLYLQCGNWASEDIIVKFPSYVGHT